MSDLRTRLERIADRTRPDPDAFARLERARRRHERNRRIEAGVVAFIVAIAGSIVVFSAFRSGDEQTIGGDVVDSFDAIWPEPSHDAALAVQEAVDSGDPALAWRLDAGEVALAFARDALGWSDALLDHTLADTSISWRISVVTPPGSCPSPPVPACLPRHAVIELQRLDGAPSGIWNVVDVQGEAFDLRVSPGEKIAVGGFLAIPTTLEEGTEVAVGVAGTGPCSGFAEQTAVVLDAVIVLPIRGVREGCKGYVYALTPSTPAGQVELGRFMFAYHEPKPALEYAIEAIAAMPVRFVASEEEAPSVEPAPEDTLHVTCDRTTIQFDPEAVVGTAGVHVIVDNTSGGPLFFQFFPQNGSVNGTEVQPGITELALQAAPGTVTVRCWADGVATEEVEVEVLDPHALFVPFDVACAWEPELQSWIPFAVWQGSDQAPEPIEFVRSHTAGLLPTDLVERAGYPEAANPVVRVIRDGAVVGEFELYEDAGEWAMGGIWCSGTGITVPEGPDPYPRGAFVWCPDGPFPEAGRDWSERASDAAIRFVDAYSGSDEATVARLLDASVPSGAEFPVEVAPGTQPAVLGTSAAGGELVRFACGPSVDAYTVSVTIDDGTDSASLDFTVYLVFRGADGWKVWAVY